VLRWMMSEPAKRPAKISQKIVAGQR